MTVKRIEDALRDTAFVAGAGCATVGVWKIYHPAGFVFAGFLLMAFTFFTARPER
jgi:hypothetical protein